MSNQNAIKRHLNMICPPVAVTLPIIEVSDNIRVTAMDLKPVKLLPGQRYYDSLSVVAT